MLSPLTVSTEALPDSAIKKAKNLVRDANLAVIVGVIPIPFFSLIFVLPLVQWYLLKKQYPILAAVDVAGHAGLAKEFRSALARLWFGLWFGLLFYPCLIWIGMTFLRPH